MERTVVGPMDTTHPKERRGLVSPPWARSSDAGGLLAVLVRNTFPVVLAALLASALSLLSPGLFVADSWMTLVTGREIVQHGIPHHDSLTIWGLGREWTDQQWLAQLFWYGVDRATGLRGVSLAGMLFVVTTFAGAMAAARQLGATARSTFLVALVVMFAAPWSWQIRAQQLALPLFVLTLWLAADHVRRPSRRLLIALPVLALWANLHGSVLVGALVVSLAAVIAGVRSRTRASVVGAAGLAVASWLCALATPYGASIVGYYKLMLVNPPFARLLTEWQRTTPKGITAVFFLIAVATVAIAFVQRRRLVLFDTVVLAVTLLGALQALRGIVWFALAVIVFVPRLLDGVIRRPDHVQMPRANAALAVLSIVAAAAVAVVVATKPQSWFEHSWPTKALAAVEKTGPTSRVLASDRHADWLLWRIPSLRGRIAYDVRFELYTRSQIVDLARFDYRRGRDWQAIAKGYDVIVVDQQSHKPLTAALLRMPGVRSVYRDKKIAILVR